MIRISFRQGMLLGFCVIALLLGGVVLQSWFVLERLFEQSRQTSARAIQLTAEIQELGERSIDLERSARQYQLLGDPVFLQRFDDHLGQSLKLVDRLDTTVSEPMTSLLGGWRMMAKALREGLEQRVGKSGMAPLLARLDELNGLIRQNGQRWIEAQNAKMLADLEHHQRQLGVQIALAFSGALLAVMAMGWWLVRPVRQLEVSIGRLGTNRFDEPVRVGGPDDLRRLGKRLDWLRQRLSELESDRERALRHVSHELKTPLTALKEGIALLRDEVVGPLAGNQREVVDILQHNVSGLQQQIESLLRLNAAAFEARNLQLERANFRQLMQAAVDRHDLQIRARRLKVAVDVPDDAHAQLDVEKMAIIFDNLLSNAIDFSPDGGEISLRGTRSDGRLCFECIDAGPGVASEDATRIFDPFVQGQRPAPVQRRGSGVGLSIVRELARAMGGSVCLLPAASGAHFCVELPDEQ